MHLPSASFVARHPADLWLLASQEPQPEPLPVGPTPTPPEPEPEPELDGLDKVLAEILAMPLPVLAGAGAVILLLCLCLCCACKPQKKPADDYEIDSDSDDISMPGAKRGRSTRRVVPSSDGGSVTSGSSRRRKGKAKRKEAYWAGEESEYTAEGASSRSAPSSAPSSADSEDTQITDKYTDRYSEYTAEDSRRPSLSEYTAEHGTPSEYTAEYTAEYTDEDSSRRPSLSTSVSTPPARRGRRTEGFPQRTPPGTVDSSDDDGRTRSSLSGRGSSRGGSSVEPEPESYSSFGEVAGALVPATAQRKPKGKGKWNAAYARASKYAAERRERGSVSSSAAGSSMRGSVSSAAGEQGPPRALSPDSVARPTSRERRAASAERRRQRSAERRRGESPGRSGSRSSSRPRSGTRAKSRERGKSPARPLRTVAADTPAAAGSIDVVVAGLGAQLSFRMPAQKRLRKMLKVWSERVGLGVEEQAFVFGAREISVDDTPQSLGMVAGQVARVEVTKR